MKHLQARILIKNLEGGMIAYLYNRESFDFLKIEKQTWDNSQFIEIGQVIEYNEKKYKVENVNFKMYSEFNKVDNTVGINMYSPTDLSDYNCQIGVFVSSM
jgi:hypothetical protein